MPHHREWTFKMTLRKGRGGHGWTGGKGCCVSFVLVLPWTRALSLPCHVNRGGSPAGLRCLAIGTDLGNGGDFPR